MDIEALELVGWKPVFHQEMMQYPEHLLPARVIAVQRTGLSIAPEIARPNGSYLSEVVIGGRWYQQEAASRPTVGDWILVDPLDQSLHAVLPRTTEIKRLSPAGNREYQLIAANIDTAFLVTSCNADFSLGRLERYLSVVMDAGIQPVIVITKADLSADPESFLEQVQSLGGDFIVETVNSLDADSVACLTAWCGKSQTIALLGSSGVGKSTLVNTLAGREIQTTQSIREEDGKGRHTTTHRSLHILPSGGVILDSPGMREFQIADASSGVNTLFAEVEEFAQQCRFSDCAHDQEPGCAVRGAIESGALEPRRLESYFKLLREEQFNTETVSQRHSRMRQFGKQVKNATAAKNTVARGKPRS